MQRRILFGEYAPSTRIPPRSDLVRDYRVSPVTVQRVFDRLVEEGYVCPRGCKGTFVSERPPHLNRFWIVFPYADADTPTPFRNALTKEALKVSRRNKVTISVHVGHGGHFREGNYRQLLHDVTTHRTAGIIFASAGSYWNETPLRTEEGIPRVALSHGPVGPKDIALVRFDRESFFDKALDWLKAQGRARVALLSGALPATYRDYFLRGIETRGLETRPYWLQSVPAHEPDHARNLVHLLLNPDQRMRPDSLIVLDDSLIASMAEGIKDAGAQVPDELAVIAHANFPHTVPCAVPLRYLGYDVSDLLEVCIEILACQRRGEKPTSLTRLLAVFEEELDRRSDVAQGERAKG